MSRLCQNFGAAAVYWHWQVQGAAGSGRRSGRGRRHARVEGRREQGVAAVNDQSEFDLAAGGIMRDQRLSDFGQPHNVDRIVAFVSYANEMFAEAQSTNNFSRTRQ